MSGYTHVIISGNIVRSLKLEKTTSGIPVASCTVAVNQKKDEEAIFIKAVLWRKLAEIAAEKWGKGDPVALGGTLYERKYEKRDGSKGVDWGINVNSVVSWPPPGRKQEKAPEEEDIPF